MFHVERLGSEPRECSTWNTLQLWATEVWIGLGVQEEASETRRAKMAREAGLMA